MAWERARAAQCDRTGRDPRGRGFIRREHLPVTIPRHGQTAAGDEGIGPLPPGGVNLDAIERSLVLKALQQARHNRMRAAKLLGLTRAQLHSCIEKYGLAETPS